MIIQEEFLLIIREEKVWIMTLLLLDGANKMELNIGLSETHGDLIGDKEEILD